MDALLTVVTVMALALASAMGAVTWRIVREERRRSAARVARLMARAGASERAAGGAELGAVATAGGADVTRRLVDLPLRPLPGRAATARGAAPVRDGARPVEAAPARPAGAVVGRVSRWSGRDLFADLFTEAPAASVGPDHRMAVAIVVVLLASAVVVALTRLGGARPAGERPLGLGGASPLALVSLGHATGEGRLTVTGLVENPPSGRALDGVTALVSAFGADGALLGTASAPVAAARLAPGTRAAFAVTVTGAAGAVRYRVSFRGPDGAVLGHVDRRGAGAVAPVAAGAAGGEPSGVPAPRGSAVSGAVSTRRLPE